MNLNINLTAEQEKFIKHTILNEMTITELAKELLTKVNINFEGNEEESNLIKAICEFLKKRQ